MLIYLSKQSKFTERVAGEKKGRIEKFSLREGGGGWSNLFTSLLLQLISCLPRHFISLYYVDPWLDDTHLWNFRLLCLVTKLQLSDILRVVRIPPTLPLESYWNLTKQETWNLKIK